MDDFQGLVVALVILVVFCGMVFCFAWENVHKKGNVKHMSDFELERHIWRQEKELHLERLRNPPKEVARARRKVRE